MYNLPTITADYTTTVLSLTPSQTLPVVGSKSQVVHEMDDGSISVISESDTSAFEVTCQWNTLTADEHATVLDFWHNTAKANGMERTFKWLHPITEITYVVRFMTDLSSQHKDNPYKDIGSITLLVEGISV